MSARVRGTNDARVGTNFTETCYATGDGFTTAVASSVCISTHHRPLLLLRFDTNRVLPSLYLLLLFLSPFLQTWISPFFVPPIFFFFPSYDILNIPPFEEQVENPIERSHEPKCIIVLLEILSGKDNGCEFSGGWLSFREAVHLRNRSCKRLVYIVDNMSITFDRLFSYVER